MREVACVALLCQLACAGTGPRPETLVVVPVSFVAVPESLATRTAALVDFPAWPGDDPLRQILEVAFRDGPSLAEAAGRVSEARARRKDAAWQLAPTVSGSASYTKQQVSSALGFGAQSPRRFEVYDVGGEASWEVDVFGRLRKQLQARGALATAAEADREAVRIGLTAEVASVYFTIREVQHRLGVARDNAENQRRSLQLTEQRLEAGRGTAFDVQRARAQLAATTATIPLLEAETAALSAALSALAGQTSGAFDTLLSAGGPLPGPVVELGFGTPASLIARRPEVRAAERSLAAADRFVGSASAALLPRLSLGAAFGSTSLESDRLFGDQTSRYTIGPLLTWPVFNIGRLFAERDVAAAQRVQAAAVYRATVLQTLQQAESAVRRYEGTRAALVALEEAATASAEATSLARLRFEEGVTDFLQVLDAQRTQLETQDRLVRGRGELAQALVEVYRSFAGERESLDGRGR